MSYTLGFRIKELRSKHDFTQENMAELLGMSRQRYARLENGQVDISFTVIKQVADALGLKTTDITSVVEERKELVTLFREKSINIQTIDAVAKIQKILEVFNSHEKLYYQMKEKHTNVN